MTDCTTSLTGSVRAAIGGSEGVKKMVIVRVYRDVARHFPSRRSEWVLSIISMVWGLVVMAPGSVFEQSAGWSEMRAIMSEDWWGFWAFTLGFLRFVALFVNGTFHTTVYSHYSPHVRAACSFLTCLLWTQIVYGLVKSGHPGTGLAVYPGLLLLDISNVFVAMSDAGELDRSKANGRGR